MPRPIAAQLKDAEKLIRSRAEAAQAGLMLELTKRVVEKTPVDIGRARANWQAGIGSPDRTVTDGKDRGWGVTIAKAGVEFDRAPLGVPMFLTNSLPYIIPLEFGHSKKQAPGGMLRLAMAELRGAAARVAAIVRQDRG